MNTHIRKIYQVLNQYDNPASEDHLCIFETKEQAAQFKNELKELCPNKKFKIVTGKFWIDK